MLPLHSVLQRGGGGGVSCCRERGAVGRRGEGRQPPSATPGQKEGMAQRELQQQQSVHENSPRPGHRAPGLAHPGVESKEHGQPGKRENAVAGQAIDGREKRSKYFQGFASVLLILTPFMLTIAFFIEPAGYLIERPISFFAVIFLFAGSLLTSLLNVPVVRRVLG